MKEPEDNEIFDLFRARLTGSETNKFSEDSWDEMEQLLDKQSRKRVVVMWPYRLAAGVAAILLLFVGFYFLRPSKQTGNNIVKLQPKPLKPTEQKNNTPSDFAKSSTGRQVKTERSALAATTRSDLPKKNSRSIVPVEMGDHKDINIAALGTDERGPAFDLAALNTNINFTDSLSSVLSEASAMIEAQHIVKPATPENKLTSNIQPPRRQLAISVLAAPDLNSTDNIGNGGRLGGNFGLQVSMQLSKRFSISTGASYAIKPYQTSSAYYKPQVANWWASHFGNLGKPDVVTANCKVLDIPVNINYQLMNHQGSSLAIGGGVSSYFMLNETYHFSFADPSVGTSTFSINNRNQHILGLVNLNATYERRLNNRFGILVQPYLKLPISNIGFGQVDLKSAGVAVGVSWAINSFKIK